MRRYLSFIACISIFYFSNSYAMIKNLEWHSLNGPGITRGYHTITFPDGPDKFLAYNERNIYVSQNLGKNFSIYPLPAQMSKTEKINEVYLFGSNTIVIVSDPYPHHIYYSDMQSKEWFPIVPKEKTAYISFTGNGPFYFFRENDAEFFDSFSQSRKAIPLNLSLENNYNYNGAMIFNGNTIYSFHTGDNSDPGDYQISYDNGQSWQVFTERLADYKGADYFSLAKNTGDIYYINHNAIFQWHLSSEGGVKYIYSLPDYNMSLESLNVGADGNDFYFVATNGRDKESLFHYEKLSKTIVDLLDDEEINDVNLLPSGNLIASTFHGTYYVDTKTNKSQIIDTPLTLSRERKIVSLNNQLIGGIRTDSFELHHSIYMHYTEDHGKNWANIAMPLNLRTVKFSEVFGNDYPVSVFQNHLVSYSISDDMTERNLSIFNTENKTWENHKIPYPYDCYDIMSSSLKMVGGHLFTYLMEHMKDGSDFDRAVACSGIYEYNDLTKPPRKIPDLILTSLDPFYYSGTKYYYVDNSVYTGSCYNLYASSDPSQGTDSFSKIGDMLCGKDYSDLSIKLYGYLDKVFLVIFKDNRLLMRSNDGGKTFVNILPDSLKDKEDLKLRDALVLNENTYIIATNYGVYMTQDAGHTFSSENTNLDNVDILKLHLTGDEIVMSTNGSGLFSAKIN